MYFGCEIVTTYNISLTSQLEPIKPILAHFLHPLFANLFKLSVTH